eukprot:snap_masked-scaffold_67-processed-gene-0.32-mRNA-1 protein AED:1.00 eAED:1.00 QI:0/0/0/0/1/1/3/0/61
MNLQEEDDEQVTSLRSFVEKGNPTFYAAVIYATVPLGNLGGLRQGVPVGILSEIPQKLQVV